MNEPKITVIPARRPLIRADDEAVFLIHERSEYSIRFADVDSIYRLLALLEHLKQKDWMTLEHAIELLRLHHARQQSTEPFPEDM